MSATALFISYSRRDRAFVDRLARDLETNGFDVWTDTADLDPGTANWEKAIREAIQNAAAVILVASPDSLSSDYVQGELTVAQSFERPIYPIWAAGERWIDCVPLEMAKAQYVDARGDLYALSIIQLSTTLKKHVAPSSDDVQISLPYHDVLTFAPNSINYFNHLLDQVFIHGLLDWYKAVTYGRDWVLGHIGTRQLALPWYWLKIPNDKTIFDVDPLWGKEPIATYDIEANSSLGVWDMSKVTPVGIAVQNDNLAEKLKSDQSVYHLVTAIKDGSLQIKLPDEINPDQYQHTFFIGLFGRLGQIAKKTIKEIGEENHLKLGAPLPKLVLVNA